jgi:superfamily II DNA or RNA helicase
VNENYWADQGKTWPKGHPQAGTPIVLRDYQYDVVNKFLENPQSLQEVATGAGKTITTATLSHLCEPYGRTMVIVPNKSLVVQTEEDYKNLGLDVGVYFGDRKELNKTHTICTWQSLNVLDKKSHDDASLSLAEFCEGVCAIIIDEVHQAKADVLTKLATQNFKNCAIRWGLTGTIPKEDWEFQSLLASIGPVINQVSAHDLQEKGVLANLQINVLQTNDIQVFRSFQEEYTFLVTDPNRLSWISDKIKELAMSGNTLVLINRIDTGNKLIELIPEAVFVSGGMKLDARKEEYDEIKTSDEKIIVATYGVAAVGINIPRIFNLVLLEPGKSFVRVIQSIGRGIRKAEDKDFVQIWDITSACKYSKRHLTERKKYYKDAKYPFTITKVNL